MFRKFPSIEQFKSVIKQVKTHCEYNNLPLPTLKFNGTVKLHGANSCVGYNVIDSQYFTQSRERIITPEDDNYGFSNWAMKSSYIQQLVMDILNHFDAKETIHIYGELAGKGIQKKVAIDC